MLTSLYIPYYRKGYAPRYRRNAEPAAPAPSTSTPAPAPTPASTPAASPAAAAPTASATVPPPAAPSPATPVDDLQDGNYKQLRTRYQEVKDKAAILDTLGIDSAALPNAVKTYNALHSHATAVATKLGYDAADFKEAWEADPAKTLALLQAEEAKAAAAPPAAAPKPEVDLDGKIKEAIKPYTDHINTQVSEATMAQLGVEMTRSLEAALPGAPPEVHELVKDYVEEHLSSDKSSLIAMKARKDFSSVDTAVKFVAGRLQQVLTAWVKSEAARTGGRVTPPASDPTTPASGKKSKFTIDQLIEKPELLGSQYASNG